MSAVPELSVAALKRRLDAGDDVVVIDVREDDELATARTAFARQIRMAEVPERLDAIPRDRDVVVMCHAGGRSERVTRFLMQQGYDRVWNLAGGIDAWSTEIDPGIPVY